MCAVNLHREPKCWQIVPFSDGSRAAFVRWEPSRGEIGFDEFRQYHLSYNSSGSVYFDYTTGMEGRIHRPKILGKVLRDVYDRMLIVAKKALEESSEAKMISSSPKTDPAPPETLKAAATIAAPVPPPPYPINYGYAPTPAAETSAQVECPHCRQMVPADKPACTAIVFCNELRRPKWR